MAPDPTHLSQRHILRFWFPLAATWLMMSIEGPYLAAVIARLPDPKLNLAAFGVAFSLALILEAPVIMLMSASTALVSDRGSLGAVRKFSHGLSLAVTAAIVAVLVPGVFRFLAHHLFELPSEVAERTYIALLWLLPWPGAIGYRRFYQGVLIRQGRTRRVGYGTGVRLVTMGTVAFALYRLGVEGATAGAVSLSAGVIAEAVACRIMVRPALFELGKIDPTETPPTQAAIARFYAPLALSAVLTLAVHPMATFFLAHARAPVDSLAVFPVVRALVFVFSCVGLSYQEVGIALIGKGWEGYRELRRFAAGLAIVVTGSLALVALTPICRLWFEVVSGLSPDLSSMARVPTIILICAPALTVSLSFFRALHVHARRTRPITTATLGEVAAIGLVLWLGINLFDGVGVTVAAVALVSGRVCSNLVMLFHRRPVPALDTPRGGRV